MKTNSRRFLELLAVLLLPGAFGQTSVWHTADTYRAASDPFSYSVAADLAFDPAKNIVYGAGSAGLSNNLHAGVIRASSDGGATWSTLSTYTPEGWPYAHFRGMTVAPNGTLLACGETYSDDLGKYWVIRQSNNGGATWFDSDLLTNSVLRPSAGDVKAAPTGEFFAAGWHGGVYPGWRLSAFQWIVRKSTDNGGSWRTVDLLGAVEPYNFSYANAIHIAPGGAVFVVGQASVLPESYGTSVWTVRRSLDRGETWSTVDSFQMDEARPAQAFAVTMTPSGDLYVAGSAYGGSGDRAVAYWVVRRSTDMGATWETVDLITTPGASPAVPQGMTASPSGEVWVTGYLVSEEGFYSAWITRRGVPATDGGVWWYTSDLAPGLGHRGLALTIDQTGKIYAAGALDADPMPAWSIRRLDPLEVEDPELDIPLPPPGGSGSAVGFPPIRAQRSGKNLLISWPALVPNAVLESASAVPSSQWTVVPVLPVQVGSDYVVILDLAGSRRFFRLRQR